MVILFYKKENRLHKMCFPFYKIENELYKVVYSIYKMVFYIFFIFLDSYAEQYTKTMQYNKITNQ